VLFSPNDVYFTLAMADIERYDDVTREALRAKEDFRELTSYAGRRMAEKRYWATGTPERSPMLICDDDEGPLHQLDGLVVGFMDTSVRFMTWGDLGIFQPDDPDDPDPFLGEDAAANELGALSSE